jgi:hypothetical protein
LGYLFEASLHSSHYKQPVPVLPYILAHYAHVIWATSSMFIFKICPQHQS